MGRAGVFGCELQIKTGFRGPRSQCGAAEVPPIATSIAGMGLHTGNIAEALFDNILARFHQCDYNVNAKKAVVGPASFRF